MRLIFALLAIASLRAQSYIEPKSTAGDYPVHAETDNFDIGADFLIHSFSGENQTFFTDDYLVVEVAIYPKHHRDLLISTSNFLLRFNGKRDLVAQAPAFVGAGLKYPDWERRPSVVASAGPIIVGRPQPIERFPGDRRPTRERLPAPPGQQPASAPEAAPVRPDEVAVKAGLPEGTMRKPVAGYLYFAHRGKLKGIKTIDLIVKTGDRQASLRLR